jgi:hypothetical protein
MLMHPVLDRHDRELRSFTTRDASWHRSSSGDMYEVHREVKTRNAEMIDVNGVPRTKLVDIYVIPAVWCYVRFLDIDLDKHNSMMAKMKADEDAKLALERSMGIDRGGLDS